MPKLFKYVVDQISFCKLSARICVAFSTDTFCDIRLLLEKFADTKGVIRSCNS